MHKKRQKTRVHAPGFIRVLQKFFTKTYAINFGIHMNSPLQQRRKVHVIVVVVLISVGAVNITQLTLKTFVDNLFGFSSRKLSYIAVMIIIYKVKKSRKRRAELEAHAATMTYFKVAGKLFVELLLIPVFFVVGVVRKTADVFVRYNIH